MKFHEVEHVDSEDLLNLTSMIDVVFTLLAFFIITVRVFGSEHDAAVGAASTRGPAGLVKGDLPQLVSIELRNAPDNADSMSILIGGNAFNDPQAITQQLNEINLPEVPVEFSASPTLSVDNVMKAIDAALHSPMKKVTLRQIDGVGVAPAALKGGAK